MIGKSKEKQWHVILFFGSLWGVLEATLGYVLHLLPSLISGSVMFPIATVIMTMAYKRSHNKSTVTYVALVAAMIKVLNLLVPGVNTLKVINPAMAIIIEGLVVSVAIPYLLSQKKLTLITNVLAINIGWKAMFTLIMFAESAVTGRIPSYLKSFAAVSQFVLVQGVIAAVIGLAMIGIYRLSDEKNTIQIRPLWSGVMCIIAVIVTFF